MSDTVTFTDTEIVLAEMLTENTGTHFLDSGGAYGRNWERNQGITVSEFVNSDKVKLTKYGPVASLFHYLNDTLEYAPELDAEFQEWLDDPIREYESYLESSYSWCENFDDAYYPGFNSYNGEDILSQGFQVETFRVDMDDYCCLSIHGGCDIRGGYTRPRIFKVYSESFGWSAADYTIYTVDRKSEEVVLDIRGGEIIDRDGSYIGNDEPLSKWANFWEQAEGCPIWDEEKEMWKAPDGDGYLDVDVYWEY